MAQPLAFATLWRDTLADTRALMPLALPVAAAFVLLPQVALEILGPPLPRTAAGMTPNLVLIDLVVPSLIALVAQAAIVRLTLDRRALVARSVGEALGIALRAWPPVVVALVAAGVPIAAGMLLVVPGFYLAGRLGLALPLVLDGSGPVAAVERSWALTDGNGWRVIGFTLLLAGWFVLLSAATALIGGGIVALLAAVGAGGAGAILQSTLAGVVAAIFTVFSAVGMATIYRELR